MSVKVNVVPVIRRHWATLRDERTGRPSRLEILIQYALPVIVGLAAFLLGVEPSTLGNLIAGLALIFGFFFALAVFVFQLRVQLIELSLAQEREYNPLDTLDLRVPQLIDELFTNACYSVLATGAATFSAVVVNVLPAINLAGHEVNNYLMVVVVALAMHVTMLVLMCIKRISSAYVHLAKLRTSRIRH